MPASAAVVVLLLAGALAGLQAAAPPSDVPRTFATPESLPGDRLVYRAALVAAWGPETGLHVDARTHLAVERLPDRLLPEGAGALRAVQEFSMEWEHVPPRQHKGQGLQGEDVRWQATAHDLATGGPVAVTVHMDDAMGQPRAGAHRGSMTLPQGVPGPCGHHHGMQGQEQVLRHGVRVLGACPPRSVLAGNAVEPLGGSTVLHVTGMDAVQGREAVVLGHAGDPEALRLWFTQDVPYPVRILSRVPDPAPWPGPAAGEGPPDQYVLLELVRFERGSPHAPPAPAGVAGWLGPRQPWGPSEDGVEHPFPLSEAYRTALGHPDGDGMRAFVQERPDAAVVDARHTRMDRGEEGRSWAWSFTLSDGQDAVHATVERAVGPVLAPLPGRLPLDPLAWQEEDRVRVQEAETAGHPGPEALPESLPRARALMDLAESVSGDATDGWGFSIRCGDEACSEPRIEAWGGTHAAGTGTEAVVVHRLATDGEGAFHHRLRLPSDYPEPRFSGPQYGSGRLQLDVAEGAGRQPWGWPGPAAAAWTFPAPATTTGIGFLAIAAGTVAFLLYGGHGVGGVGLFSRIRPDDLLEHPVRSSIVQQVRSEPGIHFQELVRRLEAGRGTIEHHLRKLVDAGHVLEQAAGGFTCYFPRTGIDRRLMEAAPMLKSHGARAVLDALVSSPAQTAQDLAHRLGMAPSTVNYHCRRLGGAGLVESRRSGRKVQLMPTPLAHSARSLYSGIRGRPAPEGG